MYGPVEVWSCSQTNQLIFGVFILFWRQLVSLKLSVMPPDSTNLIFDTTPMHMIYLPSKQVLL
jgi:hypothetical protein